MAYNQNLSFGSQLLKGIAITSLAIFLLTHIPIVNSVAIMLVPLPILYYFFRLGRFPGVLIVTLSMLLVLAGMNMANTSDAFMMTVMLAILGFVISEVLRLNYPIEKTVIIAAVVFIVTGLVFVILDGLRVNLSLWEIMKIYMTRYFEANIQIYSQIDPSSEQIAAIKENSARIVNILLLLLPGLSLVSTSLLVLINLFAAKHLFHKFSLPFPDFGDLTQWRVPEKLIWLPIGAGFILLLPWEPTKIAGLNILILLLPLYVLNGLAVAEFFQKKLKVSLFFRLLFYLMIFAVPYVIIAACIVGLVDVWFDFRKRGSPEVA